jgi:hypothetical protein
VLKESKFSRINELITREIAEEKDLYSQDELPDSEEVERT